MSANQQRLKQLWRNLLLSPGGGGCFFQAGSHEAPHKNSPVLPLPRHFVRSVPAGGEGRSTTWPFTAGGLGGAAAAGGGRQLGLSSSEGERKRGHAHDSPACFKWTGRLRRDCGQQERWHQCFKRWFLFPAPCSGAAAPAGDSGMSWGRV